MRELSLQKPSEENVRRFLDGQSLLDFSYPEVGATADTPPAGYAVDRTRMQLGSGEPVFEAAKAALRRWQQFRIGWVDAWSPDTPIEVGQVVAIMGWAVGFWWLNSCRIIYVVDERGSTSRFGFAYGTLPSHVERGEERFLIEWNRDTDDVCFDILAFSRPNHILTRLGYPLVRRKQKQFGRDSAASMFRAVNTESTHPRIFQSTD